MSIPILRVEGFLIVEFQGELEDAEIAAVQQALLEKLHSERARGVLIDLSGLEVVDSYTGRVIRDTAGMARLMGAPTAVTGLCPAVAITLVEMGLELPGIHTDLNLERGLEWLRATVR